MNFAVGITNLLYFLLRLLATEDFLLFMFEMETIGKEVQKHVPRDLIITIF